MNRLFIILSSTYDLIVIDENETPLAAGPAGGGYYIYAVVTVILAALIALAAVWFTRRNVLKRRLMELRERTGSHETEIPFSIKGLKEAIDLAEAEVSAVLI